MPPRTTRTGTGWKVVKTLLIVLAVILAFALIAVTCRAATFWAIDRVGYNVSVQPKQAVNQIHKAAQPNLPAPKIVPLPNTAITTTNTVTGTLATGPEINFVQDVPDCVAVNGPWLKAFGQGQTYKIDPKSDVFDHNAFNFFEGVVVGSDPKDLHTVRPLDAVIDAEQGNVWNCGAKTTEDQQHTILFQSADKKWQNLTSQKLAHPMHVVTPYGDWSYATGEQPAWALGTDDTNLVCPFTSVSRQDPAGVIQPDGSFVGAPGKAGCDFVEVLPDGSALRYHGAIDNFPYPEGARFFLFTPGMSNADVAKAINVGSIADGTK